MVRAKKLAPLNVGDRVFLQNQTGHNPRRWERTGIVLETKEYDQYLVKVDGTGRAKLRNRKFLRKFSPINNPTTVSASPPVLPRSTIPTKPLSVPFLVRPVTPTSSTFRVLSPSPLPSTSPLPVHLPPRRRVVLTYSPQVFNTFIPESEPDLSYHISVPAPVVYDETAQVPPSQSPVHQQSPLPRDTMSPQPTSRPKRT